MKFKVTDKIEEEDKEAIFQGLLEYNLSMIEYKNPKDLGIYYEDSSEKKLAGLIGDTHGNWLTINFLWVSEELRCKNIGSSILKKQKK